MQCSPSHVKFLKTHNTCFSKTQLFNLADTLNLKAYKSKSKNDLWILINQHMSKLCNHGDEHCWLNHTNNLITNSHVPKQPKEWSSNPYTWLSNLDLMKVMVQYEKKYRSFKFLGAFPIDFAEYYGMSQCISKELCNLNLSKFNKSIHKFACIFNLDKHNQSGSHWVAVFFNRNKSKTNYGFYFFDSVSTKIPKEIHDFGLSIQKQINDPDFQIHQNVIQKQFNNTECGMFCLHFIIQCLKNIEFHTIINTKYRDEDVHKYRSILFRRS